MMTHEESAAILKSVGKVADERRDELPMIPFVDIEAACEAGAAALAVLVALRRCRDKAPAEWDALMATDVGVELMTLWDEAKR